MHPSPLSLLGTGLALVLSLSPVQAQLSVSELMARNVRTLRDSNGEYTDWFELHNAGAASVSLSGFYVTDSLANLKKWRFPSVSIGAGGYLVVFASGKNRTGSQLHTNFRFDGKGESLILVRPDGTTVVDSLVFTEQRTDISYGRTGTAARYYPVPTPGRANNAGVAGFVQPTTVSHGRGFYTASIRVGLASATAGATIRYTTNGSPPTASTGSVYSGPVTISRTTVLRAAAFHASLAPSEVESRTYVFPDDVLRQPDKPSGFPTKWGSYPADYGMDPEIVQAAAYRTLVKNAITALPVLSVSLPTADLFGSSGIYPNSRSSGPQWEREASAEYFDTRSGGQFALRAGLNVQGGASRNPSNAPKHSLSLRFRDSYQGDLRFDLLSGSRVDRFDALHLRAVYNNSWIHWDNRQRARGLLIRDQWMRDSLIAMGQDDGGGGRYVSLYLNGLFWGVYNLHERAEAAHYAQWNGGSASDLDARNGSVWVDGNASAWNTMRAAVTARNWATVQRLLAVDNYIDFLIVQRFGGNSDLKSGGNWRAAGGGSQGQPFRFYSWDAERVLESENRNGVSPSSDPPALLSYLRGIPDFATRFGDRVHRHLANGGALTTKATAARLNRRIAELDPAIVAESARWGDYRRDVHSRSNGPYYLYSRNGHWLPETRRLQNTYFPRRTAIVAAQFRSLGLYPSLTAPTFSQHGGAVKSGYTVSLTAPSGTIYYGLNGEDPRAPGGGLSTKAVRYTGGFKIYVSSTIKARVRSGSTWSALTEARFLIESISINEFLAKNDTGIKDQAGEREDWIELYNENARTIDLSGMYLSDSLTNLTRWRIPNGTTLAPGATYLVWADDEPTQGSNHATFKLTTAGESIVLTDIDGKTILDRVTFGPQRADISTGRLHDGEGRLVTFPVPSPRAANSIAVCGSKRYSTLDPTRQAMTIDLRGTPGLGKTTTVEVRGGPATGARVLIAGVLPGEVVMPLSSSRLMIDGPLFVLGSANAAGAAADITLPIPNTQVIVGVSAYFQAWTVGPWHGSEGLEIKFCK